MTFDDDVDDDDSSADSASVDDLTGVGVGVGVAASWSGSCETSLDDMPDELSNAFDDGDAEPQFVTVTAHGGAGEEDVSSGSGDDCLIACVDCFSLLSLF